MSKIVLQFCEMASRLLSFSIWTNKDIRPGSRLKEARMVQPIAPGWGASYGVSALLIAATGLLAGCGQSNTNTYVPPPLPKVTVARPLQQPVTTYLDLTGNTSPVNSVDLVARVQGFLESIDYVDGASVKKGDQLFGIQRDSYQAQLDQANATLASNQATQANAQTAYQRQLTLSRQSFTPQSQVDDAKTTLDQAVASVLSAKANIQIATINLGYTKVTAPFDGTVTNHLADVGSLVGVSSPTVLATIVQTDPLYVYFTVSEPQVLAVKQGLAKQGRLMRDVDLAAISVEIGLQGEDGYPHKGHLDYVAPEVDSTTGTLQVRALFDNKDHAMLPGLFVRVRVPVGPSKDGMLVPADAIGADQLGNYVLVVGKDDQVEQRQVELGQRQGRLQVVLSGLDAADWVVTEGIQMAVPGAKVSPEQSTLDAKVKEAAPASSAGNQP
jgi:multidrug efflux system membrane fusion protein